MSSLPSHLPLQRPALTSQQTQAQVQTLALSPQQQHAVRLLQMSSADFEQQVGELVHANPFLESEDPETGEPARPPELEGLCGLNASVVNPASAANAEAQGASATEAERGSTDDAAPDAGPDAADGSALELSDWADAASAGGQGHGGETSALDLLPNETTLRDHLHAQLHVLPLDARDLALAKAVVESLDDDGYLRSDPAELLAYFALEPIPDEDEWRIAVRRVQSLEPAGVGARDLRECLMLQLEQIACPVQRRLATTLLTDHFRAFVASDPEVLARRIGCELGELEAVRTQIRRFDPRPGQRFGAMQTPYVVPDVIARRQGKRWVALLNPAVVPRARLNQRIVDLYTEHRQQGSSALAANLQEARWTMRNIEHRFGTIVAVAQAVLDRQRLFMEYGPMAMKPLALKEIAERVGVHASTVSRVTCNKYVATPVGTFELKRFFSRAMVMPSGNACSPTAIRGLVRDLIARESANQPLSDKEICAELALQGLHIARRTVTKYRCAMRIEAAAGRRRLVPC